MRSLILLMGIFMMAITLPQCSGCNKGGGKGEDTEDTAAAGADTGGSAEEDTENNPCPEEEEPPPDDTGVLFEHFPIALVQADGSILPEEVIDNDHYTYYDEKMLVVRSSNKYQCIERIELYLYCTEGVSDDKDNGYPEATYQIWKDGVSYAEAPTCIQSLADPDTGDYGPQPINLGGFNFWIGVREVKIIVGNKVRIAEIKAFYKTR